MRADAQQLDTTGPGEGQTVRECLSVGHNKARQIWPFLTLARVYMKSPYAYQLDTTRHVWGHVGAKVPISWTQQGTAELLRLKLSLIHI